MILHSLLNYRYKQFERFVTYTWISTDENTEAFSNEELHIGYFTARIEFLL